jgi:hypothetical protein
LNQPSYTQSLTGGGFAGVIAVYALGILNAGLGKADAMIGWGEILTMSPTVQGAIIAAGGAWLAHYLNQQGQPAKLAAAAEAPKA